MACNIIYVIFFLCVSFILSSLSLSLKFDSLCLPCSFDSLFNLLQRYPNLPSALPFVLELVAKVWINSKTYLPPCHIWHEYMQTRVYSHLLMNLNARPVAIFNIFTYHPTMQVRSSKQTHTHTYIHVIFVPLSSFVDSTKYILDIIN